jgi:hypothetical protein
MPTHSLADLNFTPHEYGWRALLPNFPRFLGREVSIDIHTRSTPSNQQMLPPISATQAALVRSILPFLALIIDRVERELVKYQKDDDGWRAIVDNPNIWLSNEDDDGESWTFVIESTENPDFGWHVEFKLLEFNCIWAGD